MTAAIIHFEPDARTVGDCRCGGLLKLVEDRGAPRPIDAQCDQCFMLTGVARDWSPQMGLAAATPATDVREDLGF